MPDNTDANLPADTTPGAQSPGSDGAAAAHQPGEGQSTAPEPTFDADGNIVAAAEPTIELVEVERNGRKYQVPKDLHGELLMQEDYTRKTMSVAERARAIEAQEQSLIQRLDVAQRNLAGHAQLHVLEGQIKSYEKINWAAESANNPQVAQQQWYQYQQMKDLAGNLKTQLADSEQQFQAAQQQAMATRASEGLAVLAREIPGWGPQTRAEVRETAKTGYGFSDAELSTLIDPRMVRVLHDAMQFRKLHAKSRAAPASAPATNAPQFKPVGAVATGAAPATGKDPAKMSASEWQEWRNQQVRRRKR